MRSVATTLVMCTLLTACPHKGTVGPPQADHRKIAMDAIAAGDAKLDSARFADAHSAFQVALGYTRALGPADRARAHFGRGVALQELVRSSELEGDTVLGRDAIAEYDAAARLDSARYFKSARYNAALVHHELGQHTRAAERLIDAAEAAPDSERPALVLRAVRELQATRDPDPARVRAMYRWAARAALAVQRVDPAAADLRITLAADPALVSPDSTLTWLTAGLTDSSRAASIADAALAALRGLPRNASPLGDSLLLLLVRANVVGRLSPEEFDTRQREALQSIGATRPTLQGPIVALERVYATRDANDPAIGASPQGWWTASRDRRQTWSSVLRTIGEWHERTGAESLAVAFYESALGSDRYEIDPWSDLDAVLPLLLIYARRAERQPADVRHLERLVSRVFGGKTLAYERGERARIRQFHTTLGAFYAREKRWQGVPRGAIFQLERMRAVTRELGPAYVDPPELLEQLMEGYLAVGRFDDARGLVAELKASNAAVDRPDTSPRWQTRIDSAAAVRRRNPE